MIYSGSCSPCLFHRLCGIIVMIGTDGRIPWLRFVFRFDCFSFSGVCIAAKRGNRVFYVTTAAVDLVRTEVVRRCSTTDNKVS